MKVSSIKTVYDFMRYCRMPLWFQRSIRDMKVGDTFILGKYTQPVSHDSDSFCVPPRYSACLDGSEACFVAEAWIEKERGVYSFYATWTFPTKPERAHVMTFGEFRIHKGGIIEFDNKNVEPDDKNHTVRSFALVSRYLAHMLNCMSDEDNDNEDTFSLARDVSDQLSIIVNAFDKDNAQEIIVAAAGEIQSLVQKDCIDRSH